MGFRIKNRSLNGEYRKKVLNNCAEDVTKSQDTAELHVQEFSFVYRNSFSFFYKTDDSLGEGSRSTQLIVNGGSFGTSSGRQF